MLDLSLITVDRCGPDWVGFEDEFFAQSFPNSQLPGPFVIRDTPEEALAALLAQLGFGA